MAKTNFGLSNLFRKISVQGENDIDVENVLKKGILSKNDSDRFFVLWREVDKDSPARLEYYKNEKSFNNGELPSKKLILKNCYISLNPDSTKLQNSFVIFHMNKDRYILGAKSLEEMQEWLDKLQHAKNDESFSGKDLMWRVDVMKRGLGSSEGLSGIRLVCLTSNYVRFFKFDNFSNNFEYRLDNIKKCGHFDNYFFLELGSKQGNKSGSLYMKTEDKLIALNMEDHIGKKINNYFPSSEDENLRPFHTLERTKGTTAPRNRAYSESTSWRPSQLNRSILRGPSCSESIHSEFRDRNFRKLTNSVSQESNIGRTFIDTTEYEVMASNVEADRLTKTSTILSSPSNEESSSGYLHMRSPTEAISNPYLEMRAPTNDNTSSSSRPIPISPTQVDSLQEMSPQSCHSSNTSTTTSSDKLNEQDDMSGSGSIVGSCFSTDEEMPIRTSSIGSKPDQYKRKNSSPMLTWSPVSRSWSGPQGTYFKPKSREQNTMMLDYLNPNISQEDKEKKSFWSSLTGSRLRSNSKSSGSSNSKIDKKEDDAKGIDIPLKHRSDDYCEVDFQNSPRSTSSDPCKGYLPMQGSSLVQSSQQDKKVLSQRSYVDMARVSPTSSDGYVDMTQSGFSFPGPPSIPWNIPHHQRDLSSPQEDFMSVDATSNEKLPKKRNSRKEKRKKDDSRRRKSDLDKFEDDTPVKNKGAISAITNLITRRSSSSKSPHQGSRLSPTSPVNSLSRRKKRDSERSEDDSSSLSGTISPPMELLPLTPQSLIQSASDKREEKMLFTPTEEREFLPSPLREQESILSSTQISTNISIQELTSPKSKDDSFNVDKRNYVNMSIGGTSSLKRLTSEPAPVSSSKSHFSAENISSAASKPEEGYMFMDASANPSISHSIIASRPKIPSHLLSKTYSDNPSERARSHSGPGAPVGASDKEKKSEERSNSACSSPTSHSPPISPSLGSISSMSSLSEGGLSSASSTCTVINMGATKVSPQNSKNSSTSTTAIEKDCASLNYVSLDPGEKPSVTTTESGYTEMDFKSDARHH